MGEFLLNTLIIGFIIALIIILLVDIYQVRKMNELIHGNDDVISIEKYHELKWRINLLISITAIVSVILGYAGYSLRDFTVKEINEINNEIGSIDSTLLSKEEAIDSIDMDAYSLSKQINKMNRNIKFLQNQIQEIQNENIRKWEFQIIRNVAVEINSNKLVDTVYFKELLTVKNNSLPSFQSPPLVNLIRNEKIDWLFFHRVTTKDYFILEQTGSVQDNYEIDNVDIWMMFE